MTPRPASTVALGKLARERAPRQFMELLDLSPDLLALLLAHCTHTDWAHCACTCAALRSAVGDQRERCLSATELSLGKLPLLLCPSLRQLSSLRELRLRWVPIGDAHLSAVAGLPQLSLLDLTGAARVTNNGVRLVLAGCPAIEERTTSPLPHDLSPTCPGLSRSCT